MLQIYPAYNLLDMMTVCKTREVNLKILYEITIFQQKISIPLLQEIN